MVDHLKTHGTSSWAEMKHDKSMALVMPKTLLQIIAPDGRCAFYNWGISVLSDAKGVLSASPIQTGDLQAACFLSFYVLAYKNSKAYALGKNNPDNPDKKISRIVIINPKSEMIKPATA